MRPCDLSAGRPESEQQLDRDATLDQKRRTVVLVARMPHEPRRKRDIGRERHMDRTEPDAGGGVGPPHVEGDVALLAPRRAG